MRTLVILLLVACHPKDDKVEALSAIPGPQIRMDFARPTFYSAPFPSDDLISGGVVDLEGYPNPDQVLYADLVGELLVGASGFGTTSGIFFAVDEPITPQQVDVHRSMESDSPVYLVDLETGDRIPVDVDYTDDGGPFGADNMISLLPLQGVPLRANATYAAVIMRDYADLGVSRAMVDIAAGESDVAEYVSAAAGLDDPEDIAGMAVFTTWDPTAEFLTQLASAQQLPAQESLEPFALVDVFDDYCVFESAVEMPVYQAGEPPYETGGGWASEVQDLARSRMWLTVPRAQVPASGWPTAAMIRTGGGGDNPLVERGFRPVSGGPVAEPGTGPAQHFARGGWAGFSVDGPHGGLRNVTGADEQFLMFNVTNPVATRDNVRQSALETALIPDLLETLSFDVSACPDASGNFTVDLQRLALMGHSMGATIAPLALAGEPRFGAAILSGAGGSYIHNLVYKESPLTVRPLADAMLNYPARGRTIHEHDPFLSLLQWAAEPADPPVYGSQIGAHALVIQGIVDTYILPPMANATNLSLSNDLAGASLDVGHPDLTDFQTLEELLPLVGGATLPLPAGGNWQGGTRIVVQHAQGPIEDGHEVMFQTEPPQHQYRCFLESWLSGIPTVPVGGAASDPCD